MTLGTMMLPTITAKIMSRPGKVIRASGYAVSAHAATVASVVTTDTMALFRARSSWRSYASRTALRRTGRAWPGLAARRAPAPGSSA